MKCPHAWLSKSRLDMIGYWKQIRSPWHPTGKDWWGRQLKLFDPRPSVWPATGQLWFEDIWSKKWSHLRPSHVSICRFGLGLPGRKRSFLSPAVTFWNWNWMRISCLTLQDLRKSCQVTGAYVRVLSDRFLGNWLFNYDFCWNGSNMSYLNIKDSAVKLQSGGVRTCQYGENWISVPIVNFFHLSAAGL